MGSAFYAAVYDLVAQIPEGRVMSYGQIAGLLGKPRAARQVGYALAATPADLALPWHRVINSKGEVSRRADGDRADYQRLLLEAEGVVFTAKGRVAIADYRWWPSAARP